MQFSSTVVISTNERYNDGEQKRFCEGLKKEHEWKPGELFLQALNVGDIYVNLQITDPKSKDIVDEHSCFIVERKTITDLAQSLLVTDNRLNVQAGKMLHIKEQFPRTRCGFLIEGTFTQEPFGHRPLGDVKAALQKLTFLGLHVWYTENVYETFKWIVSARNLVSEHGSVEFAQRDFLMSIRYSTEKKENITEDNFFAQSLMLINSVSPRHVLAITAKYKNLPYFMKKILLDRDLLVGLHLNNGKKIGLTLSRKIYMYYTHNNKQA